jgi:hypothetical protein
MKNKASLCGFLMLALLPGVFADEGRAVRSRRTPKVVEESRVERGRVRRDVVRKSRQVVVPDALVLVERQEVRAVRPVPGLESRRVEQILVAADRAAEWTAEELSRTRGRVEVYRVGWFRGMNMALDDRLLGEWDREQGFASGYNDQEARRTGRRIGRDEAVQLAAAAAERQVESRFMDLRREPLFNPGADRSSRPAWELEGSFAERPVRTDLFERFPVRSVPYFKTRERSARFALGFDRWNLTPLQLCDVDRLEQFYDAAWMDPEDAFRFWSRNSARSVLWKRFRTPLERRLFQDRFESTFEARLPRVFNRNARPAFENGFDDGWEYGAWIQYESSFQEGFAAGFDQAVWTAADESFARNWNRSFDRFYEVAFDRWNRTVRTGIQDVRLEDGDQDGVFEPGETILVFYELVNYGGGSGFQDLAVRGRALESSSGASVEIRGRGPVQLSQPLKVRIGRDVPVRDRSKVVLETGGQSASARLMVARPLQFQDGWQIDGRAALDGIAVVELLVANRSRRPVSGEVRMEAGTGTESFAVRDLGQMPAGEQRSLRFRLTGLDPLDILSGELEIGFRAADDQVVHDRLDVRFPNVAVDLSNDDLLTLMVRMAEDSSVTGFEVRRARDLMMSRMRADWRIAARGRRNPYKKDFKSGAAGTALGELVMTIDRLPAGLSRSDVFAGLGNDLSNISGQLPGAHPFLRKWFRKLAGRIA